VLGTNTLRDGRFLPAETPPSPLPAERKNGAAPEGLFHFINKKREESSLLEPPRVASRNFGEKRRTVQIAIVETAC
jgi:hypothetical protein